MKFLKSSKFWCGLLALLLVAFVVLLSIYLGWLEVPWNWLRGGTVTQLVAEGETITITKESNSTTIRNVGLVVGGIIAIGLAVWRSKVAERQADAAQQQADVAQQQADVAQRGLLNERYQRGAEMLGSETIAVRLGGIYALQRLAEEHPSEYHIQTMLLLCTFVRYWITENMYQRREDVQTAMDVIGHRTQSQIELEIQDGFTLDLRFAPLRGIELSGMNLSRADLTGAHLWWANLAGANLTGADISGARISGANLFKVNLAGTDISGTEFLSTLSESTFVQHSQGLTQTQLDEAHADPDNPPKLDGVLDTETGEQLVWRGKPPENERT